MTITNEISCGSGTMGVREMPDRLDGGNCHLRDGRDAVVRVNLDGIYTSLCQEHRDALVGMLKMPLPKPCPNPNHDYFIRVGYP